MNKPPQYIVCAAIRKGNLIICGARHFDSIMRNHIKLLNLDFVNWEQGFIDQYDNFLTREEAFIIANNNHQIQNPTISKSLFSENLY